MARHNFWKKLRAGKAGHSPRCNQLHLPWFGTLARIGRLLVDISGLCPPGRGPPAHWTRTLEQSRIRII
jgi:hypothetical protein